MQSPPRPDDPIYYNMNASSPLIQQQTSWNSATPSPQAYNNHYHHQHPQSNSQQQQQQSVQSSQHGQNTASGGLNGHTNPSYQHSTPNLTDVPDIDEYITHRPPSVRSSYSNFHGTRPLSYNPNGTAAAVNQENLFAGLAQQNHHQTSHQQQYYQQAQQTKPLAIPQVPNKRVQRDRFLSNGPPAYNLQNFNHTPPDSETTM